MDLNVEMVQCHNINQEQQNTIKGNAYNVLEMGI